MLTFARQCTRAPIATDGVLRRDVPDGRGQRGRERFSCPAAVRRARCRSTACAADRHAARTAGLLATRRAGASAGAVYGSGASQQQRADGHERLHRFVMFPHAAGHGEADGWMMVGAMVTGRGEVGCCSLHLLSRSLSHTNGHFGGGRSPSVTAGSVLLHPRHGVPYTRYHPEPGAGCRWCPGVVSPPPPLTNRAPLGWTKELLQDALHWFFCCCCCCQLSPLLHQSH